MKKIALFGGTFDPVHNGHLKVAETVLSTLDYSELWFVPAGLPPHKDKSMFSFTQRIEMLNIICALNHKFNVYDKDFRCNSKSYTIDLINQLKNEYTDYNFSFIIGADNVMKLNTWRNYKELLSLIDFIVIERTVNDKLLWCNLEYYHQLRFLEMKPVNVSSSEIRDNLIKQADISDFIPKPVNDYILKTLNQKNKSIHLDITK